MFSKKPYTAITATIEVLTNENNAVDDLSGLPNLVEVVKLNSATGPGEAARAIRKKLKYGNVHRQKRALVILDGLIQNAGSGFRLNFADEPLLERLRVAGNSNMSDPEVRKMCREMFAGWARYAKTPGMERVARLHKEMPLRKVAPTREQSKVIRETDNPFADDDDGDDGNGVVGAVASVGSDSDSGKGHKARSGSFFSSRRDKNSHSTANAGAAARPSSRRPFNLEEEKANMKSDIGGASIAATNLLNILRTTNRESERISTNKQALELFKLCKQLRRRIVRYIHYVQDEQWLGSLIKANDDLVEVLITFEALDRSIDADSDSEDERAAQAHQLRMETLRLSGDSSGSNQLPPQSPPPRPPPRPPASSKPLPSGESVPRLPPRPPRPQSLTTTAATATTDNHASSDSEGKNADDDDDENNPFADRNAVSTPIMEDSQWP